MSEAELGLVAGEMVFLTQSDALHHVRQGQGREAAITVHVGKKDQQPGGETKTPALAVPVRDQHRTGDWGQSSFGIRSPGMKVTNEATMRSMGMTLPSEVWE